MLRVSKQQVCATVVRGYVPEARGAAQKGSDSEAEGGAQALRHSQKEVGPWGI